MPVNRPQKLFSGIKICIFLCATLLISGALVIYLSFFHQYNQQKKQDLRLISSTEYEGIFCSMYPNENYPDEAFTYYRGLNVLSLHNSIRNTKDINQYLSEAFASENTINTVYLGLDPAQIRQISSVTEHILSYAKAHPETAFEVLLPAPSMKYWLEHTETETEEILSQYQSLASLLFQQSNVIVFFMGNEEWLISNPANYTGHMAFNRDISLHLALSTFCDKKYLLTPENTPNLLASLKNLIQAERTTPTEYPDLSHMDIVFFGDSIIGNYTNSSSVPNVVSSLTQSRTYNCARGGATATHDFITYAEAFLSADASAISPDGPFTESLNRYLQDDHSGRQLVFILNFGLNDYFDGCPVASTKDSSTVPSYTGSLQQGINILQSRYPDSDIVLMTPSFTGYFSNGTEIAAEKGSVLTEYVNAAMFIANEMNVVCLDNYNGLGVNASNLDRYTDDALHLNGAGRFLLSKRIIEALAPLSNQ